MLEAASRPAWAEVDLDAVRHNATVLAGLARPAALCAVVKADGYGHGAVPVARAALEAGATWLAVAVVEEGLLLRHAGIDAAILLLSEPPPDAMAPALAYGLTPTLYTRAGVEAAAAAAGRARNPVAVHVKVDTGMHRVGASPDAVAAVARAVEDTASLRLEAMWTHLAVADDPAQDDFTALQLRRFEEVRQRLAAAGIRPDLLHAANSAGAIAHPSSHYDLVRCGIALYGHPPGPALAGKVDLRPALSLKARVALVKELPAGERLSYGRCYEVRSHSRVATVPLGYADGVPRRLSSVGGEVLVGGSRRPVAGTVTMDQFLADCGPSAPVAAGDEVVLIGRQGGEEITAEEWADRLGTISYEVLCGIGARVPRSYLGSHWEAPSPAVHQGVLGPDVA